MQGNKQLIGSKLKNVSPVKSKRAAKHYHLAMHVFGLMTQAITMSELDEVVTSAVVVFSSSHSDRNVGKHFENLQGLLTNSAQSNLDDSTIVEDCVNDIGPTPFKQHFEDLITQTVIEKSGDDNMYFCPTFIPSFLPLAGLWSGLLLGDLGRHGTGTIYQKLSQKYKNAAKKPTQDPKDKARQGQSSSTSKMTEHAEDDAQGGKVDASSEYINAEESTVYLADPARNSAEQAESDNAANKFRY
ncbi:Autophagy-related protein 2 [Dissostichus eleginoides]|uniref:Autophagy-related protein 2 n=1 Tax=Dissostichus eleginoides TaxID=100907 RepID=A0AAD9FHY4_DISEL|nr:Autophagy-related protein 2 [Dissostichus eleginoides]